MKVNRTARYLLSAFPSANTSGSDTPDKPSAFASWFRNFRAPDMNTRCFLEKHQTHWWRHPNLRWSQHVWCTLNGSLEESLTSFTGSHAVVITGSDVTTHKTQPLRSSVSKFYLVERHGRLGPRVWQDVGFVVDDGGEAVVAGFSDVDVIVRATQQRRAGCVLNARTLRLNFNVHFLRELTDFKVHHVERVSTQEGKYYRTRRKKCYALNEQKDNSIN